MTTRRLAVLRGGPSREHGVSLESGQAVVTALRERGHDVVDVTVGTDGRWSFDGAPAISLARALVTLTGEDDLAAVEAVFVALHGAWGEDGTLQGTLESLGMPYTGSGVLASALAMDKERTKELASHHGIATPEWRSVTVAEWASGRADVLTGLATLPAPFVVKPAREGSSFGISLVDSADGLADALDAALDSPGSRALVEHRVAGTEVTCAVLGNHGGPLRTLPVVEIVPHEGVFFDFEAKYEGASDEICPARIPEVTAKLVRETARRAHTVLGCDGLSRTDFIISADEQPWFLETNTVPGMTPASLSPLAAMGEGLTFPLLCEHLIDLALARHG